MTVTSWTDRRVEYQQLADEIAGHAVLITKDGPFWRIVSWCLWLLSFGKMSRSRFLEEFATTLGPIQAYPRQWPKLSRALIIHEARHTQQCQFAGWFVPVVGWFGSGLRVWVGLLPMAIAYGIFPLPVLLAWGRFRLELDADATSWKECLRRGWATPAEVRERATQFANTVASWAYLRPWPRTWTVNAFSRKAAQVIAAHQAVSEATSVDDC